jgi:hypothetical protein
MPPISPEHAVKIVKAEIAAMPALQQCVHPRLVLSPNSARCSFMAAFPRFGTGPAKVSGSSSAHVDNADLWRSVRCQGAIGAARWPAHR